MYNNISIEDVKIELIKPEIVPLSQEKQLQKTLFPNGSNSAKQWEEIKLCPINEPPYKYQYINGRRRTEIMRSKGVITVRAIIVNVSDKDLHIAALVANSGRPNHGDEANHFAYLRDKEHMSINEIVLNTNYNYQTVCSRLRLKDKLTKPVFKLLLSGEITGSTALEFTRLDRNKQGVTVRKLSKRGDKITCKIVAEEYRKIQSDNITMLVSRLELTPKEPKQVILTAEMMNKLVKDDFVEVVWKGQKICLARCEL